MSQEETKKKTRHPRLTGCTVRVRPCEGEAHSNPMIDNCGVCMPDWGTVAYVEFPDGHKQRINVDLDRYVARGTELFSITTGEAEFGTGLTGIDPPKVTLVASATEVLAFLKARWNDANGSDLSINGGGLIVRPSELLAVVDKTWDTRSDLTIDDDDCKYVHVQRVRVP